MFSCLNRSIFVFYISFFSVSTASAVDIEPKKWTDIGQSNEIFTVYVDTSTIKKNGDKAQMWILMDYKSMQPAQYGMPSHMSAVEHYEYDCKKQMNIAKYLVYYQDHSGKGNKVYERDYSNTAQWQSVRPGSVSERIWQVACGMVNPPSNKKKQGDGWDSWLEATGNKAKIAPKIASSEVKTTGSAPASVDVVIKACQHLINKTGPGQPGIGSIYEMNYLSPVDAASVYGNMGPQGKLTPLKVYARYRDGENMYTNAYLQKDPFGEFKCIESR